ncbi:(R)-mandelonitrile lyase 1-like [Cucumis melo var. makuwa]|uniref:(R)-mandelonitrile lyase 1-like n=1 Tax=Cucumis melo var. makuwa TaxID=1194695 RepID=A0A5D3C851_CUCMM|nr:(R)-mandelonitrile lyase 1-like [Cucumis melo var. makuwa]
MEVDDVEDQQLNVSKIIVDHRVVDHIKDDTLCKLDVDLTAVERLIVCHVVDEFINDDDEQLSVKSGSSIISNFSASFDESDDLFDFNVECLFTTHTLRRPKYSRILELDRYIAQNGKIPISIALGQDKPISPQVVHFSNTINVLTRDTFPVCFLKWTNVTLKYIKLVKGGL